MRQETDVSARRDAPSVIHAVAVAHGISVADMTGHRRFMRLARPRHEAMYLLRQMGMTLKEIGMFLNRDHSTIIYGIRRWEERAL